MRDRPWSWKGQRPPSGLLGRAIEAVPIAREGLFSAMKVISRAGVPIVGADARGEPLHRVDLRSRLMEPLPGSS